MTRRSEERETFLKDLLITAVEGGIGYWAGIKDYRPEAGTVKVREEDDVETGEWVDVDLDVVAHGIALAKTARLGSSSGPAYVKEFWRAERTNGDEGDYDAEIADQILQLAVLGEVVYG